MSPKMARLKLLKPSDQKSIRFVQDEDLSAITAIEKQCFPGFTAYSKRQLAYLIRYANSICLVETENSVVRGFIIATYRRNSSVGSIETLDVDPQFQRRGIGMRLLTAAEEIMRQRGIRWSKLEVSDRNEPALRLYLKAGYSVICRLEGYYKYEHWGSRDAVRMVKAL